MPSVIGVAPPKPSLLKTLKFALSFKLKAMTKKDNREFAAWTKSRLQELGPTYIKLGQFISTRPDIFDKDMIDEMLSLQDDVPAFPYEVVSGIVSSEVGDVFADFEQTPIASASISQVHKATLRSSGKTVAVKVQRPYIKEYFDNDFKTLGTIFDFLSSFNVRSINDTRILLDQCYMYLYEELSFKNEISNAELFSEIVKDYPGVIVPRPYKSVSSSKVLVMEYIPSSKISSTSNPSMALELMRFFLSQVMDYGVIHADPHPGNLGITDDGKIVLYDFGQVSKLDTRIVMNIKPLVFAIFDRDARAVTEILIRSGAIILTQENVEDKVESFVMMVLRYFENMDFRSFRLQDSDLSLEPPFKINPQLILVFRSLSLLEGICKDIDATFSYYDVVESIIGDMMFDFDYIEHRARKDIASILNDPVVTPAPMQTNKTIDRLNDRLQRSELRQRRMMYAYTVLSAANIIVQMIGEAQYALRSSAVVMGLYAILGYLAFLE